MVFLADGNVLPMLISTRNHQLCCLFPCADVRCSNKTASSVQHGGINKRHPPPSRFVPTKRRYQPKNFPHICKDYHTLRNGIRYLMQWSLDYSSDYMPGSSQLFSPMILSSHIRYKTKTLYNALQLLLVLLLLRLLILDTPFWFDVHFFFLERENGRQPENICFVMTKNFKNLLRPRSGIKNESARMTNGMGEHSEVSKVS